MILFVVMSKLSLFVTPQWSHVFIWESLRVIYVMGTLGLIELKYFRLIG